MTRQTKIVKIPETVRDQIQALQYEVDSRKDLLSHMINQGVDIHSDNFKLYEKEYQEFFVQYNTAKEDMQNEHLVPAVPGKLLDWNLNFATCEVTCNYEG